MTTKQAFRTPLFLGAIAPRTGLATAADTEFILKIRSPDDLVRGPAWKRSSKFGAAAVIHLVEVMTDSDMETARAAKRALWKIVRHVGRPGARMERKAVAEKLVESINKGTIDARREVLWMLSEIGNDESVPSVAALLFSKELREDARATLERIPGDESLSALKSALATGPAEFKPAIAVSLRTRGVMISGYPNQKLVPKKKTGVKPA